MTVTITIPDAAFLALYAYLLVGLLAYVPLNHWAARFISPRRRGLEVWKDARIKFVITRLAACAIVWPIYFAVIARDEWKWGLGRRWRNRRV